MMTVIDLIKQEGIKKGILQDAREMVPKAVDARLDYVPEWLKDEYTK